eukprot:3512951-Heterocapsa_arctica.AAC.1
MRAEPGSPSQRSKLEIEEPGHMVMKAQQKPSKQQIMGIKENQLSIMAMGFICIRVGSVWVKHLFNEIADAAQPLKVVQGPYIRWSLRWSACV